MPKPSPPGRRLRWWVDVVLAVLVFLYTLPTASPQFVSGPHVVALVVGASMAACVALPWRRARPRTAFAVILAAAGAHQLVEGLLPVDVLLLPALYSVGERLGLRWAVPAAVAVLGWLSLAVVPAVRQGYLNPGELATLAMVIVWVATWGLLARSRRASVESLRERTRDDERARIARELHDIVSHGLGVVVVLSEGALATVRTDPDRAEEALRRLRDTSRTAMVDMRRMLGVLRPEEETSGRAPQPGLARLHDLADESRAAGMPVTLHVVGDVERVPAAVGLSAYRIIQEALTNVRKHSSGVSNVTVDVRVDASVELTVSDDGTGRAGEAGPGGHGLVGMRERVAAHGGTLDLGPRPFGGFQVRAELPMEGDG